MDRNGRELKSQIENKFMAINLLSLIRAHTRDMTTSSGCCNSLSVQSRQTSREEQEEEEVMVSHPSFLLLAHLDL